MHAKLIERYELIAQRLAEKESAMIQHDPRIDTQAALCKDLKGHLAYLAKQAVSDKSPSSA